MYSIKNNKSGFTLIEVIIYIALFSLLLGTAFVAAYQLIDGSVRLGTKNTIQDEGNFIMRKINWALTGVDPSTVPVISGSACEEILTIQKTEPSYDPTIIRLNDVSGKNTLK
ncbi:hypothetical protein A2738_01575 [Candidatus Nomurabacteria bacterium RIFCSPHIGHO2_01_FULL_42_15]|uniref:Prepilin-type N-terminal cleavage/methylation domain-containing protein n=1 Tax=Candidatus Nomurabacteria bacterium RIFCSPHIGHO2_01_FULL_42_15 TaxID=1801742 RepID=A0A1F6VG03_9BACT|nr:MAG: hypothetical protein A2738_01575 [Candidatus Nomurabacteria bacterium RIFCSPHIGHO2_01_FULL_42_15]OGI93024.1 MAG: hypothetical protein A3A99_00595 [Candidatus Nomurabacteria bacterium RIFCSPLOWO2_01_FULL_41_18]